MKKINSSGMRGIARRALAVATTVLAGAAVHAAGVVGTTFPEGFAVPQDASLGTPVIGFGASGRIARTPVVFLHGNGGVPYENFACTRWSANIQAMAQFFADSGYNTSELWALGYQGDQCDLALNPALMSSLAHTNTANVPDLRAFIRSVLTFTGATRVDIVAHGMGVTLARELMRQDSSRSVRRMVAIAGPNGGTIQCAAHPENSWAFGTAGNFRPATPVCQELGSPSTPFLTLLNQRPSSKRTRVSTTVPTMVIRNADADYTHLSAPDGYFKAIPSVDYSGLPTDFSDSALVPGATVADIQLTGQAAYDPWLFTAHVGIANSPTTWQHAISYLRAR